MLKKDITFKDLDGNTLTETFWFHLNEGELTRLALGKEGKHGGFDAWVRNLISSNDGEVIVENFEKILLETIGQRSADNKSFIKTDEIRNNFRFSDAYSVLFMELMTDEKKMSDFVNAVVPGNLRESVAQRTSETPASPSMPGLSTPQTPPLPVSEQLAQDTRPDWLKEGRVPTQDELKGATPAQIQEAFRLRSEVAGPTT